ncbi:MAG TPA: hypothetical protein VH951_00300, partial [Dehalococcoidia bacterium]
MSGSDSIYRGGSGGNSSLYRQGGSGGASLYGSSSGPAPGAAARARRKATKKGGGGFLHGLVHAVKQTGSDLESAAVHAPGGLYAVGKAAGKDWWEGRKGTPVGRRTTRLVKEQVKATEADLKHPLRHPGYTALDVLGIGNAALGAAARVGAVGKALAGAGELGEAGAGARAAAATRAATRRPLPRPRLVSHDGVAVRLPSSAAPISRVFQHSVDRLRERFPNVPVLGAAHVVGKERLRSLRYQSEQAKAPINAFIVKARKAGLLKRVGKLGPLTHEALAKQHALRVVAEGVPIEERVRFHQAQLHEGHAGRAKNPEIAAMREKDFARGHAEQIRLNRSAHRYVRHVT